MSLRQLCLFTFLLVIGSVITFKMSRASRKITAWYSLLISLFSARSLTIPKAAMRSLVVPKPRLKNGGDHSHPLSAALRSCAEVAIDQFIGKNGFDVYNLSMSPRDEGRGERYYYITQDLLMAARDDPVLSNDAIKIIDADYYYDMNAVLKHGKPIVLYTFVPETAGGVIPLVDHPAECTFSITEDKVAMNINGGAVFPHYCWDYERDLVTTDGLFDDMWVYEVEQMQFEIDRSRRIILITPRVRVPWYVAWWLTREPLTRRKFSYGDINIVRKFDGVERTLSLSERGSYSSARIPEQLFDSVSVRLSNSKHPNIGEVQRFLLMSREGEQPLTAYEAAVNASLVFKLWQSVVPSQCLGYRPAIRIGDYADHYYAIDNDPFYDPGQYCRKIAPSISLQDAAVPAEGPANDAACVDGRVIKVRNDITPKGVYYKWAREYVELVVSKQCSGVPWSIDEVTQEQSAPLQKNRFELVRAWLFSMPGWVRSFQKKEVYPKVGAPRNISTVPTDHMVRLSCFTYAFKKACLVGTSWYQPGNTPAEISDNVVSLLSRSNVGVETDYSKYDGTLSRFLRVEIEQACMLRWVSTCYRDELLRLLAYEECPKAVTKFGVRYSPQYSRLSGSPVTTDCNSLTNGFVPYCAARSARLSPVDAYSCIGLVYGDDGLCVLSANALEKVAADLGLKLKCRVFRHSSGDDVTFLGRVYPQPHLHPFSYQDPRRTIPKLHLTCCPPSVLPREAAIHRARGYLVTDANTPIIGDWCRMVLRLYGDRGQEEVLNPLLKWSYTHGAWPQHPDPWFYLDSMSNRLEMSVLDILDLSVRLEEWSELEEDLCALDIPVPIELSSVIGDEVVLLPGHAEELQRNVDVQNGVDSM